MSSSQLILTVSGVQAAQFGASAQKRFAGTGGSIGRSDESDWVLAAPGISRTHAVVRFLNGMYFIEDRSTNGMSLNGVALTRADPCALSDGDRLQLDNFEIQVQVHSLTAAPDPTPAFDPLLDAMDDRTQVAPPPSPIRNATPANAHAFDSVPRLRRILSPTIRWTACCSAARHASSIHCGCSTHCRPRHRAWRPAHGITATPATITSARRAMATRAPRCRKTGT